MPAELDDFGYLAVAHEGRGLGIARLPGRGDRFAAGLAQTRSGRASADAIPANAATKQTEHQRKAQERAPRSSIKLVGGEDCELVSPVGCPLFARCWCGGARRPCSSPAGAMLNEPGPTAGTIWPVPLGAVEKARGSAERMMARRARRRGRGPPRADVPTARAARDGALSAREGARRGVSSTRA